mgnify:CR=1 FL=1
MLRVSVIHTKHVEKCRLRGVACGEEPAHALLSKARSGTRPSTHGEASAATVHLDEVSAPAVKEGLHADENGVQKKGTTARVATRQQAEPRAKRSSSSPMRFLTARSSAAAGAGAAAGAAAAVAPAEAQRRQGPQRLATLTKGRRPEHIVGRESLGRHTRRHENEREHLLSRGAAHCAPAYASLKCVLKAINEGRVSRRYSSS